MIETTLKKGEKYPLAATARYFVVRAVGDGVAISVRNAPEVQVQNSDVIDLLGSDEIMLINTSEEAQHIKFQLSPFKIEISAARNSIKSIEDGVEVKSMPAVQVEASVGAANDASAVTTVILQPNDTKQILPVNASRHSASVVRGEEDLYNIKLAYNSALEAQSGLPFAPQATATIRTKAAVWAHNHSAVAQTVIAVETNINTGV